MLEGVVRVGNRAQDGVAGKAMAAMGTFSIETAGAGTHRVVTVSGEADLAHAEQFWTSLENELGSGAKVVVDCSGVTFIDSQGLRVLLRALREAGDTGAELALAAPSLCLVRVLDLAGVSGMFDVVDVGSHVR